MNKALLWFVGGDRASCCVCMTVFDINMRSTSTFALAPTSGASPRILALR